MSRGIKSISTLPRIAMFIAVCGVICYAAPRYANADTLTNSGVNALHLQITQSATTLLTAPPQNITLANLQSLLTLAQQYFSARKKIEEPVFKQRLENQRLHRYNDDSLYHEPQPSVEETLIAIFRQYISAHPLTNHDGNSVTSLTQLRDLLRRLGTFGDGRLSGYTWLYNSPLPVFAAQQLEPLDQHIIANSFSSADAFRKKHQYAAAEKLYKNLLTDYAETPHAASIKILLDAAIVEDYNYQATLALAKHDYEKARAALNKIIKLYPDTTYATAAQKRLDTIIPESVAYFKKQGDKYFHPEGHVGVPQTKAGEYFEKMYNADPKGPEAGYAFYYWARSLGTQGKVHQAAGMLKDFGKRFPRSDMRAKAMFLEGFYHGDQAMNQPAEGAALMDQMARLYPKDPDAPQALWYGAFYNAQSNQFDKAVKDLELLKKQYPNDRHVKNLPDWLPYFQKKLQTGGKWP